MEVLDNKASLCWENSQIFFFLIFKKAVTYPKEKFL